MSNQIIVTSENMEQILERIKKSLKKKKSLIYRNVYKNIHDIKSVKRLLEKNLNPNPVEEDGETVLSAQYRSGVNSGSARIESFEEKYFIAIRGTGPAGNIIYVGDQVIINTNSIFIIKKDKFHGKECMEALILR